MKFSKQTPRWFTTLTICFLFTQTLLAAPAQWLLPDPTFTMDDKTYLPHGNHNMSMLEYWYTPAILSNPDAGGFSLLESHNVALRGESAHWQKFYLNKLNINNPAAPGRSLIDIPVGLWHSFSVNSVLTPYNLGQGYNWNIKPSKMKNQARLSNPGHMGGDTWMGVNTFDREPSQLWGAAEKRRQFGAAIDADIFLPNVNNANTPISLFYEGIVHERTFLNLDEYELGHRNTLFSSINFSDNNQMVFLFQNTTRNQNEIEKGHDSSLATTGSENALYTAWDKQINNSWKMGLNGGFSISNYEQKENKVFSWDLKEQILIGNPPVPERRTGWFVGSLFENTRKTDFLGFDILPVIEIRLEGSSVEKLYYQNTYGRTHLGIGSEVTILDENSEYSQYIARLNPTAKIEKDVSGWIFKGSLGFSLETSWNDSEILLTRFDPVASFGVRKEFSRWVISTGVVHDAIPMSMNEVEFLNTQAASGGVYFWNDDGDGVYESGEKGNIIHRTGGVYHQSSDSILGPIRDEFYLRGLYKASSTWNFGLAAHAKLYRQLYTVSYPDSYDSGYSSIDRSDVRGGVLYNRDPAKFGTETYELKNQTSEGIYAAMEFQAIKLFNEKSKWFLNFTVGAYYAEATTIVGNGPDYNDMGKISENSADPNKNINTRARTDFDRGYVGNLLFGWRFGKRVTWTNLIRYRDGETFGELYIADGLSQGPTIIQNLERSKPPEGIPRFTYALSWDLRLTFEQPFKEKNMFVSFDIYNLFDSRSELYEHTINDEKWRDSLEAVIARSYRVSLMYQW